MFAGGPFYCSGGVAATAITLCMNKPEYIVDLTLRTVIGNFELSGEIDSVKNLEGSKVYLFSGSKDVEVVTGVVEHAENLYKHFGANIKKQFKVPAAHAMITH